MVLKSVRHLNLSLPTHIELINIETLLTISRSFQNIVCYPNPRIPPSQPNIPYHKSHIHHSAMICFLSSSTTFSTPSPYFAETPKQGTPRILDISSTIFSLLGIRSILFRTMMNFLLVRKSLLYSHTQCLRIQNCQKGLDRVMSIMNTSILVLQRCLRNQRPRPLFRWASLMIPGISATRICFPSTKVTQPMEGFRVVNSQLAIFGNARLIEARKVDLPILGSPSSPTSARDLSCSFIIFNSPKVPLRSSSFARGKSLFPFPPLPPWAIVSLILSVLISFTKYYFSSPSSVSLTQYTKVPIGTWTSNFPPFLPSLPLNPPATPLSPVKLLVLKCLRSDNPVLVSKITSAPFPPLPPSGGPLLLYLSLKKVYTPFPPFPALTFSLTSSMNNLCSLLEHSPASTLFLIQNSRLMLLNEANIIVIRPQIIYL